ncbi:unnamed protein product, partial [Tilletia controversa]
MASRPRRQRPEPARTQSGDGNGVQYLGRRPEEPALRSAPPGSGECAEETTSRGGAGRHPERLGLRAPFLPKAERPRQKNKRRRSLSPKRRSAKKRGKRRKRSSHSDEGSGDDSSSASSSCSSSGSESDSSTDSGSDTSSDSDWEEGKVNTAPWNPLQVPERISKQVHNGEYVDLWWYTPTAGRLKREEHKFKVDMGKVSLTATNKLEKPKEFRADEDLPRDEFHYACDAWTRALAEEVADAKTVRRWKRFNAKIERHR